MTKISLFQFLLLSFIVSTSFGQKIKYKDIFGLLNTKRYEEAEPFLKRYLKETDDNPNAFLYMGIIYQEKSAKDDVLKQTKRAMAHMDSAIFFYDKAYKSINEKEVKRNDEFYQAYNRRDLRTGEFGVKLSDIQFDLEKKIEGLRERIDRVKMVKHYFSLADTLYRKTTRLFVTIKNAYPEEKSLYLQADGDLLKKIDCAFRAVRFVC
jgi:tetratricopeptide (TPR) repeat protein